MEWRKRLYTDRKATTVFDVTKKSRMMAHLCKLINVIQMHYSNKNLPKKTPIECSELMEKNLKQLLSRLEFGKGTSYTEWLGLLVLSAENSWITNAFICKPLNVSPLGIFFLYPFFKGCLYVKTGIYPTNSWFFHWTLATICNSN